MFNEDSLERELSCGICLELYTDPLQLTCMHTFCKQCLTHILTSSNNSRKLKCPDCRKTIDLGKGGLTSLKRNFKLGSIVDIYRQTLQTKEEKTQEKAKTFTKDRCPSPPEKDYAFLNDVIFSTHGDVSAPYEPHILDDLWGTFRRTVGTGSILPVPLRRESSSLPPHAPPPPAPPPRISTPIHSWHATSGVLSSNHALPRGIVSSPKPRRRPVPLPRTYSSSPTSPSRLEQWVPPSYLQDSPRPVMASDVSIGNPTDLVQHPVQDSADQTESLEQFEWVDGCFDIASTMSSILAAPPVPPRTSCQVKPAPALPPRHNLLQ